MLENINKNWISQENKEVWRETSIQALEKMKALEIKFQCTRKISALYHVRFKA